MDDANTVTLDGSEGEGGGQMLRSSLSLALVTGTPVRMVNVRAGRSKPGLLRQHLTALRAAAEVSGARVEGAELGSRAVTFVPGAVKAGEYTFKVGTAGSATLVMQTVLPALLRAEGVSTLAFEGGTHNPMAPSYDFVARAFLPVVNRMGPTVTSAIERAGFYPAGGGRFTMTVTPAKALARIEIMERGAVVERSVEARVAGLPEGIAKRELVAAKEVLGWEWPCLRTTELPRSEGPGNVVVVTVGCEHAAEVFVLVGEKGVSAEAVGARVATEAMTWLATGVPVGEHLADQLLLPMALAGGGRFVTTEPSLHTTTNARVIERFLPVTIGWERRDVRSWVVTVAERG
jgi:RNA 3'-terminal phosphate cyclase (ATP)